MNTVSIIKQANNSKAMTYYWKIRLLNVTMITKNSIIEIKIVFETKVEVELME